MASPVLLLEYGVGLIVYETGQMRLVQLKTTSPIVDGDNVWTKYFYEYDVQEMLPPRTYEMWLAGVRANTLKVFDVPTEMLTDEIVWDAVRVDPGSIHKIPKHFITQDLWDLAIENGGDIKGVPTEFINFRMLLNSVRGRCSSICYIVEYQYHTYRLCLEAVSRLGTLLYRVPDSMKTYEMCFAAIMNTTVALIHTPPNVIDYYMAISAVRKHGSAIIDIPRAMHNRDLIMVAIKTYPRALNYMTTQDYKMCLAAVTYSAKAFKYVQPQFMTDELVLKALNASGIMLEFYNRCKPEMCLAAVQQNGMALEFVCDQCQSAELCYIAVTQCVHALKFVNNRFFTRALCMTAMRINVDVTPYIPVDMFDSEMYEMLMANPKKALYYMPSPWCHYTTYLRVVKCGYGNMYGIPEDIPQYSYLCKVAIKSLRSDAQLSHIRDEHYTCEMCLDVLKRDFKALSCFKTYDELPRKILRFKQLQTLCLLETRHYQNRLPIDVIIKISEWL